MIGAQCLKHRVLGIAHFILSPYLCSGIKNKKMRTTTTTIPTEMLVLMNHIYELNKGVRQMVLFTCHKKYGQLAIDRLESQGIYPRRHARLRHLRTMRTVLQTQINNFLE